MSKNKASLKAVILVGGPGMRLRPLTDDRPKPIVPVLNYPFLEHTIVQLKKYGVKDIILAMNYLPDTIRKYFGDGERFGVRLVYCVEKEPLGTAGAVKNSATYIDSPIIVLNGDDVFWEMDWHKVFNFHRSKKAKATIFLTRVTNPSTYGVVEADSKGRVKRFIEKPPPGTETTNWINAGGYIIEPDVLEYIPDNTHYMFENGLFPALLEEGEPIYRFCYRGYWKDTGTPAAYFTINQDILCGKAPSLLMKPFVTGKDVIRRGDGVIINHSAKITGHVIIGDRCHIGAGVRISGPVVIGADCRIEDNSVVENTILWDNVTVRAGAVLTHCIVCSRTTVQGKVKDTIITREKTAPLPQE